MSKIMVECSDPNDLSAVEAAAEAFVGKCNITYYKQAQGMIEAGKVESIRAASAEIAASTGESEQAVRRRIQRGENQMAQHGPNSATNESNNEIGQKCPTTPTKERPSCSCGKLVESYRSRNGKIHFHSKCYKCRRPQRTAALKIKKTVVSMPANVKQTIEDGPISPDQMEVWSSVANRLLEVKTYMMAMCEFPHKLNGNTYTQINGTLSVIMAMLGDREAKK